MNIEDFGTGIDVEEISRFEKYTKDRSNPFLSRVYTDKEIDYCFKNNFPSRHLAVRFCAKEAVYKAFCSVGITDLSFKDIEIINDLNKVPCAVLNTEKTAGYSCKLSLSHSKDTAVASVVVVKL